MTRVLIIFTFICSCLSSLAQDTTNPKYSLHAGLNMDIHSGFYPEIGFSIDDLVDIKVFGTSIEYSQLKSYDPNYLNGSLVGGGIHLNLSKMKRLSWLLLNNEESGIFGTNILKEMRIQKGARFKRKLHKRSGYIMNTKLGSLTNDFIYTNYFSGNYYPGISTLKKVSSYKTLYTEFSLGYQWYLGDYIKLEVYPINFRESGPNMGSKYLVPNTPVLGSNGYFPKIGIFYSYTL
ncbi:MAG: hypothetical protein ACPGTP_07595 [Bacteroidia bacterium]